MSQHRHIHVDENGVEWEVVCGFDPPLSEFFLQVYHINTDSEQEEEDFGDECDDNGVLFSISSHSTMTRHPQFPDKLHWSNGEILEQMEKWGCKKEHCRAVALDLPF